MSDMRPVRALSPGRAFPRGPERLSRKRAPRAWRLVFGPALALAAFLAGRRLRGSLLRRRLLEAVFGAAFVAALRPGVRSPG